MEQGNNQNEFVDLSKVLNEDEAESESSIKEQQSEKEILEREKIPGVYRLILKMSGGIVKTEKQAKFAVVVFIIIMNVITFSLILKENEPAQESNVEMPAQAQ